MMPGLLQMQKMQMQVEGRAEGRAEGQEVEATAIVTIIQVSVVTKVGTLRILVMHSPVQIITGHITVILATPA
jgi:hypothetical protein